MRFGTTCAATQDWQSAASSGILPRCHKKDSDNKRTNEEVRVFKRALPVMNKLYASLAGTAVVQLKDIPPRPPEYDGRITVFNPPTAYISGEDSDTAVATSDLQRFGQVVELSVGRSHGHKGGFGSTSDYVVHARFATHEQAEACVSALNAEARGAGCEYNETAYSRDCCQAGHRYSGWCTMEQGSSSLAAAHLARAERQAEQRSLQLPQRFTSAQASRAKLTDISGGAVQPRMVNDDPEALLLQTFRDIEGAHFIGKGDKPMVHHMLGQFEFIMKWAVDECLRLADTDLTIDPAVTRRARERAAAAGATCSAAPLSMGVHTNEPIAPASGASLPSIWHATSSRDAVRTPFLIRRFALFSLLKHTRQPRAPRRGVVESRRRSSEGERSSRRYEELESARDEGL